MEGGERAVGGERTPLYPLFGLELDRALVSLAERHGIRAEDYPLEVDFHTQCLLATLSFHTDPTDLTSGILKLVFGEFSN